MDEHEGESPLEKAYRLLEETAHIPDDLEKRARANAEARLLEEPAPEVAEPPEPVPPVQRPSTAPRDFHAEAAWIRDLANVEISAFSQAMGAEVGAIINGLKRELTTERDVAISQLRAEFRGELATMLKDLLAAVAAGDNKMTAAIDRHYARLGQLVESLTDTKVTARPLAN